MEDKTLTPTVPPPPSEVKIRTMRSDIASMMQSGGGAPSFQNVAISGLSMDDSKVQAPAKFVGTPMPAAGEIRRAIPEADNMPAPYSDPIRPVLGEEVSNAGPNSELIPKLIVGLVGLIALGVVVYFAYTIFLK